MLAPGEYLLMPVHHQPVPLDSNTPQPIPALRLGQPRSERVVQSSVPAGQPAEPQPPERKPFLLRLLNALGAVHI